MGGALPAPADRSGRAGERAVDAVDAVVEVELDAASDINLCRILVDDIETGLRAILGV